jgi:hypothetical protein
LITDYSCSNDVLTINVTDYYPATNSNELIITYNKEPQGGGGTGSEPGSNGNIPKECNSLWLCEEWSYCSDGVRSRTCNDLNKCSISDTPPLLMSCSEQVGQRIFGCVTFIELDKLITRWKFNLLRFDVLNEGINKWKNRISC